MKRFFALILAALAILAVFLWNGKTTDDPVEAQIQRFRALEPLAEKGDVDAQYDLAGLYQAGRGVEEDARTAAQWYLKAANKGHVAARHALGRMFEFGQGVNGTSKQPPSGTGWRPASAIMPKPNMILAPFIIMVAACRMITSRRSNGIARRPARATRSLNFTWAP